MNEVSITAADLFTVSPIIALTATGFIVVAMGLWGARLSKYVILIVTLVGIGVAALLTIQLWDANATAFHGMVVCDNYALTFNLIFFAGAILSVLLAFNKYEESYLLYPEFSAITLFATVGMSLMASSTNLLIIFLGLETLSISLYVLAGIKRTESHSLEAAFKYFLLGAFASAFLLYGIALLYGASGSLDLKNVSAIVAESNNAGSPLLLFGSLLIFIGLAFKAAVFPFHMWAPDVYQGAPTPISAFMSTGSKAAGFAAMIRVLFTLSASAGTVADLTTIFSILAVLTMFFGNITAIRQKNVKRMLAYSSIAHAGYIMIGIVAWNETGASSIIFYLMSYTFMNVGAFGVVSYLGSKSGEFQQIDDLKGLGYQRPFVALLMSVFMFSLAGLPPTAGFIGKFYLFSAAVKTGHIALVVLGVINSMISVYYYLGVVVAMFMRDSEEERDYAKKTPVVALSLVLSMISVLGIGIFPSYFMTTFQRLVSFIL